MPTFSVIVPVYNRPGEMAELLESMTLQTVRDFEVVVVEDGSTVTCEDLCKAYSTKLSLQYFYKANSGPGPSRNEGFKIARGEYFVVFDSDCIVPPHYFEAVVSFMKTQPVDAWGGPDRGHDNFTSMQRAMAYTMSSFLTTGGIRGGSSKDFQPRSFNMGISRRVFEETGGFRFERFAEDIELSIRMKHAGFHVALIPNAYVFHKRRTNLGQFFRQVSSFGKGRVLVGNAHAGAVKLTHWFPSVFLTGLLFLPWISLINRQTGFFLGGGYLAYLIAISIDAAIKTRSLVVAALSIPSALTQLIGYGSGFLAEKLRR